MHKVWDTVGVGLLGGPAEPRRPHHPTRRPTVDPGYCTPKSPSRARSASVSAVSGWCRSRACFISSSSSSVGGRLILSSGGSQHVAQRRERVSLGWIWVDGSGLSALRKRVDLSKRPGSRFGLLARRAAVLAPNDRSGRP